MKTLDEIFEDVQAMKANYEQINKLVDKKMLDGWRTYLEGKDNPYNWLTDSSRNFNLLSLLFFRHEHTISLIDTLNQYLLKFRTLAGNPTFRNKMKKVDGFHFFSTMSELSIANVFMNRDNNVEFDYDYKKLDGSPKDIDIRIVNQQGEFFIEIYTPNENTESSFSFDPNEFNQKFKRKVSKKLHDKFSNIREDSLNGKKILAVNALYHQGIMLNYSTLNIDDYFSQLVKKLPQDTNGLLLFRDDFSSVDSFREVWTIIKAQV